MALTRRGRAIGGQDRGGSWRRPPGPGHYHRRVATKTVTTLVDDIDGSTDDVLTCAFGLGDASFEIDLNAAHREELESVLAKFVAVARPVGTGRPARTRRAEPAGRVDRDHSHAIRLWAKDNGFEVSERGRISKTIVEAYEAAH
jgi:hypothetical protein